MTERAVSMAVGALLALAAVVGGAWIAEATSTPAPWPQVTRCEVIQPEDLERPPA